MTRLRSLAIGLAAIVLAAPGLAMDRVSADEPRKLPVSVLYAGELKEARTEIFKTFLSEHFTRVDTVELASLTMDRAAEADVVIIDSTTPYKESGFQMPKAPGLSLDFTKPTILMGAVGGMVLGSLKIKLDWL